MRRRCSSRRVLGKRIGRSEKSGLCFGRDLLTTPLSMKKNITNPMTGVLILLLFFSSQAMAMRVAVFPVDDLSSPQNSINEVMTNFLRHELSLRGLTVIQRDEVEGFMSSRRIRQLGMLQTQEILAARSDLQADLVMLGSLCQRSEESALLGMTIALIRTSDARTLWTSSKGVSLLDHQKLLGINAPASMADLQPILAGELFADWPRDLEGHAGMAAAAVQAAAVQEEAAIEVDSVIFTPKYVQPGQDVKCTIRFRVKKDRERVKVFIREGSRMHIATSEDGLYYQVSWVGSEDKVGKPITVAMNDPDARIINGLWNSGSQDAEYPVSLILEWPSGKRDEAFLGSYVVDSLAPTVNFKIAGKTINGVPSFRTELPISLVFKQSEPISHWEFTVSSTAGEVLLQEKGSEQPPGQFVWRGQNNKNMRADTGLYAITLKAWDRAQNLGIATEKVQLLAATPGLNLSLASERERILARLSTLDGVRVSYWRLELWSADSTLLQTYEGESLPVQILLPQFPASVEQDTIDGVLQVRDAFGVQSTKKVPHLLSQVVDQPQTKPVNPSQGQTDGEDSWQADF